MFVHPFVVAITAATVWNVLPVRTNDFLGTSAPSTRYDDLVEFVKGGSRYNDPAFWENSGKVRGLIQRNRVSRQIMRDLQIGEGEGKMPLSDAAFLWGLFAQRIVFSYLAIPEAFVCWMFGIDHHFIARMSLGYYCRLVLRANTSGEKEGVYKCPTI